MAYDQTRDSKFPGASPMNTNIEEPTAKQHLRSRVSVYFREPEKAMKALEDMAAEKDQSWVSYQVRMNPEKFGALVGVKAFGIESMARQKATIGLARNMHEIAHWADEAQKVNLTPEKRALDRVQGKLRSLVSIYFRDPHKATKSLLESAQSFTAETVLKNLASKPQQFGRLRGISLLGRGNSELKMGLDRNAQRIVDCVKEIASLEKQVPGHAPKPNSMMARALANQLEKHPERIAELFGEDAKKWSRETITKNLQARPEILEKFGEKARLWNEAQATVTPENAGHKVAVAPALPKAAQTLSQQRQEAAKISMVSKAVPAVGPAL